jgi:translation initiation factor 3 subunit A
MSTSKVLPQGAGYGALYTLFEASFNPLTLCSSTTPLLAKLCAQVTPCVGYHSLLERALLSRLLAQLSQVYSTLTITSLLELVMPLEGLSPEQVEAFLMGCACHGERNIYVDHATGTITFIDKGFIYPFQTIYLRVTNMTVHRK